MQTLRRVLAAFCTILFIVTGVMALFLFNIERTSFSAETYKQAFEDRQLYSRMPAVLAEALTTAIRQNEDADEYLKALTASDWEAVISSLLPPEELKVLTDSTLDSTFDYLNDRSNSVVVSLVPFKLRLASPAGVQAVLQLLQAQPACTVEQILAMATGFLSEGRLIFCNPPPEAAEIISPLIQSQLQVMTVIFPDEVTLVSNDSGGATGDPRTSLRAARAVMQITPLFPMVFLLGLTIFAVRGLVDWLRWWGWPFLITGATGLLIAVLGSSVFGLIFQRVMEREAAGLIPLGLLLTLRETASAVVGQILEPAAIEGLILAVLGLGAIIIGEFVKKQEQDQRLRISRPRI